MAEDQAPIQVEVSPKRVRVLLGGQFVADTVEPRLVWEMPYYPTYYIPAGDLLDDALEASGDSRDSSRMGTGDIFHVRVGDTVAKKAAVRYADSPVDELRDLVRLDWDSMDAWFEEDDEVFVHARDPHARVDVLNSTRHVEVIVDDVVVADSHHAVLLFENGLPTRYYLPQPDVRLDLLRPSDHVTYCPYKGRAEYWHLDTGSKMHENAVWTYRFPTLECMRIASHAAFFNEKVDIRVDGQLLEKLDSPFS